MSFRSFGKAAFIFTIVLAGGGASVDGRAQQAPGGPAFVLQGATLIDGLGGAPVDQSVIVIQGDRISAVGGSGTRVPPGATVLDLEGKYILPGLVESHAHYEEWMGELFLNHGVTTAMAIGGDLLQLKLESHRPTSRFPRLYDTAGRPRINNSMTEQQVREAVREWLQGSPDFTKMPDYNPSTNRVFAWAADEIHRAGLMVFGHTENAPASIRAGHDVVEHLWGYIIPTMTPQEHVGFQRGEYLHWGPFFDDWDLLDQYIREAVAAGAYLNPTFLYELGSLSPHAVRQEREDFELHSDPDLKGYFPESIAGSLLQRRRMIRNFSGKYGHQVFLSKLSDAERDEFQKGYELSQRFIRRYAELGGRIQAGTDTITGGTPGLGLHHEMELLVEAGLRPMQAIQSATGWSAEKLAGKNRARGNPGVGTIAAGSFADLVILSADPLEDIRNTKMIERVMKGGEFVQLGYTPSYYSFQGPPRKIAMATPAPEISQISPHTVVEGSPDFDLEVHGVGFISTSVIRVDGVAVPTTLVNPRILKAIMPARYVRSASPNPFNAPGPLQHSGVFGDPTIAISVFNPLPEGGLSNQISLRVRAEWMGLEDDQWQDFSGP